jgi:hypothetical protein
LWKLTGLVLWGVYPIGIFQRSVTIHHMPTRRPLFQPLADGQVWRMREANLQVTMVGKLLVHYKLGKPDAVRVSNSVNSIATIEKYLKAQKAVLV